MRVWSGTAACCSASTGGIPLLTYWNPTIEAEYQREAVKLCVSWEDLEGELLQHEAALWRWWDHRSRTFFVTLTFWEVQGQWTCHQIRLFSLTIIGYVLNPITSLSNFARIPLDRQAGFGCAITNLQRNNRFLQEYTSLLDIHKGLFPGFDILDTLLI